MMDRRTFLKVAGSGLAAEMAAGPLRSARAAQAPGARQSDTKWPLAVETSMFGGDPAAKAFAKIASAGYRFVELGGAHFPKPDAKDRDVEAHRASITGAGLTPVAAFIVFGLASKEESARREAVEQWRRALHTAGVLGLKLVTTELTGQTKHPDECKAAFRKSMDTLLPEFERAKIRLSVEPHPGDFFEQAEPTVELLAGYKSPWLGYLHCMPHTFHLGDSMPKIIRKAGPLLTHVHVGDTFRTERIMARSGVGLHLHLIPGLGEVDFRETFDAFKQVGYSGALAVQLLSHSDDAAGAIRKARKYLVEMLGDRLDA